MAFKILLIIFLVLLNGFFVAAEFAIVKVRASQLNSKKGVSKRVLASAQKVTFDLDGYLAATQLGITLASLGLGWVGESVMTQLIINLFSLFGMNADMAFARSISIPIAFALITIMHIVFGELAPKSMAIRKPVPTTFFVAIPLQVFHFVFKPFIYALNSMANGVLRLAGISPAHENDIHSEEELKLIIAESEEGGAIEGTERELIHNVFDFDDRRVKNVLVNRRNVVMLDIDQPFDQLLAVAIEEGYSRYPVYRGSIDDAILGTIHTKDLLKEVVRDGEKSVEHILQPVMYAPEEMRIKDLLKSFQHDHRQMAIVTNEYGGVEGIVTMEDLLEELVGEIQDEYDAENQVVEKNADGSYTVNAQAYISELNKYLPHPIPVSGKYETLSGLISHELRELPKEGQTLTIERYELLVMTVAKRAAVKIKVTPI